MLPLTPLWRSMRLILLIWALLLAPQAALLHALSHTLPGAPTQSQQDDGDGRAPHAAEVCDACLAFAQLGAALPPACGWRASGDSPVVAPAAAEPAPARQLALAFRARAPPAASV